MTRLSITIAQWRCTPTCRGSKARHPAAQCGQVDLMAFILSWEEAILERVFITHLRPLFSLPEYRVKLQFLPRQCIWVGVLKLWITEGLLEQIPEHWGGAKSICFPKKFPGGADTACLAIPPWEPLTNRKWPYSSPPWNPRHGPHVVVVFPY